MRFGKIFLFAAGMLCAVEACAADKVRIGVSNYNISNLTVGVAQSRGFFKQEGIDAEIIRMNPNVATMALVSRADIRSVKEVKGNTIGVGSYGSTPDIIARMVVKHHGIDPESEVKLLALGSDAARLTALKEGVIDVRIVAPPVDFEAKRLGVNIISGAGEIFRFPYNGMAPALKNWRSGPMRSSACCGRCSKPTTIF